MSADVIYKNSKKISYDSKGSFPFRVYYTINKVNFGDQNKTHGDIPYKYDEDYIEGRLWIYEKIISFWNYDFNDLTMKLPNVKHIIDYKKNKLNFRETLKLIENDFNKQKHKDYVGNKLDIKKISIDDSWLIDVPLGWIDGEETKVNVENGFHKLEDFEDQYPAYIYYKNRYVLLPLKEFEKRVNINNSEIENAKKIHMMNWKEKEEYYKKNGKPKGFGSDAKWNKVKGVKSLSSDNEMTPTEWEYWHKRENKEYLIKSFKLFESPDHPQTEFIDPRTGEEVDYGFGEMNYRNDYAFPFGYVANSELDEFIYFNFDKKLLRKFRKNLKDIENGEIDGNLDGIKDLIVSTKDTIKKDKKKIFQTFGVKNMAEFKRLPHIKRRGKIYTMYVLDYGHSNTHNNFGTNRRDQELNGRIWYDKKYISFWKYPDSYEELIQVFKDIEIVYKKKYNENLNIIKNLDEWIIEDPDRNVILVNDYKGGKAKYSEEELKAPHLMNNKEKEKWKKKHQDFFNKQAQISHKKKPIEWRDALGKFRGESVITKFKKYKNETFKKI